MTAESAASARVAFVVLAHTDLDNVARLVNVLHDAGAPVAVHIDANISAARFKGFADQLPSEVALARRRRCAWGEWSLVDATLNGLEALFATGASFTHAMLISGVDLPTRPIAELNAFLATAPDMEWIEAVPHGEDAWVKGGFQNERLDFFFPLNWKTRRRWFDRLVDLQRALKVKRRFPDHLKPHFGSQWWCLTRDSAAAVLEEGSKPATRAYFRWSWIPDESFVQTVIGTRTPTANVSGKPLCRYEFDDDGQPLVYYDDHAPMLRREPFFFARKISSRANAMRDEFLALATGPAPRRSALSPSTAGVVGPAYSRFQRDEMWGRYGARRAGFDASRGWPATSWNRRPYFVVRTIACAELPALQSWVNASFDCVCHGRLFRPDAVELAPTPGRRRLLERGDTALRDAAPIETLVNLIHEEPKLSGFIFAEGDDHRVGDAVSYDPRARTLVYRPDPVEAFAFEHGANLVDPSTGEVDAPARWVDEYLQWADALFSRLFAQLRDAGRPYAVLTTRRGAGGVSFSSSFDLEPIMGPPLANAGAPVPLPARPVDHRLVEAIAKVAGRSLYAPPSLDSGESPSAPMREHTAGGPEGS